MNIVNHRELTPEQQAFPRRMLFEFKEVADAEYPTASLWLNQAEPNPFPNGKINVELPGINSVVRPHGFDLPSQLGDDLTDQSRTNDGYRFHDVLHISLMAYTGWSSVMRSLLGVRRRSDPEVDKIDDGARTKNLEEALFGMLDIEGPGKPKESLDFSIRLLHSALTLEQRLKREDIYIGGNEIIRHSSIRDSLSSGVVAYLNIKDNGGGFVHADLDDRQIHFSSTAENIVQEKNLIKPFALI